MLGSLILGGFCLFCLYLLIRIERPKNFPPGPRPLPVSHNRDPRRRLMRFNREKCMSFEDRHKMPYTQAVIHESQRIADTVPLSMFHSNTRHSELMGYRIPKVTMVIPKLSLVLREESQWKFPHEFNPSNFLNEQGEFQKSEAFIPFSAGARVCLGEGLARIELFLVFVTMQRHFQFIWHEDAGEPDFTPLFGLTTIPKPYRMGVRLRQPATEM